MNTPKSQNKKIIDHLHKGRALSAMYAFSMWQITSLHRRLTDIRKQGVEIVSEWNGEGNTRFKTYRLAKYAKR